MKQHAVVILYAGKELPEHTATEIVAAMCNDGVTTPELVTVKYYDGDSISDAVLRNENKTSGLKNLDTTVKDALNIVFRQIPVQGKAAFQIRIAAFIGNAKAYALYGRELDEKDQELLAAIRTIATYNDEAIRLYPESYCVRIKDIKTCYEACW